MLLQDNINIQIGLVVYLLLAQLYHSLHLNVLYIIIVKKFSIMIPCMLLTRTIKIIGPTNVQIVAEVGSALIQQLDVENYDMSMQ